MDDSEKGEASADLLQVGDLMTLQQAAEYCGLSTNSLRGYVRRGRLQAKRLGHNWLTTRAAVDAYLQSRHEENIPRKYRDRV